MQQQYKINHQSQIISKKNNKNQKESQGLNSLLFNTHKFKICVHTIGKMENSIAKDFVE